VHSIGHAHDASHNGGVVPAVVAHDAAHGEADTHDRHAGHSPEMFRRRFWLSLALTISILYFADPVQRWFGYEAVRFAGSRWLEPGLATIV